MPIPLVEEMVRLHNKGPGGLGYGLGFWLRPERQIIFLEGCDAGISRRTGFDRSSGAHDAVISNTSSCAGPVVRGIEKRLP